MTDSLVPSVPERRPLGVVVVAATQFLRAVFITGQLAGFSLGPNIEWVRVAAQIPDPATGTPAWWISRGIGVALIAASILLGIGLLAGRRWAWIGAIVMSGLSLALALGAWWDGRPPYIAMLINVIAVFYLNQREVRAAFDEPAAGEPQVASDSQVVGP
jgi:hypothetical protein